MAGVDSISEWQQAVSQDAEVEPSPLLHIFKACSELYSVILDDLRERNSIERPIFIGLERGLSYLFLWADGYGVIDGSIETSLEKSKRARQATFLLLINISRLLINKLLPVLTGESQANLAAKVIDLTQAAGRLRLLTQQARVDESGTDSESDGDSVYEADDLQEVIEDLRTDAQCLLDLGSRFHEPALGVISREDAIQLAPSHTWDPALNFVERIQWRYPQCDGQLAVRLGKANWARVVRSQEAKGAHQQKRLQETWSSEPVPSRGALTTLHDSGIGTSTPSNLSLPPATQYAETTVSYRTGHAGSVRIPPMPEIAKQGVPFECMACGRLVTIKTKSVWKRHLFEDLQPYLCLDSTCTLKESTFSTKAQWETHYALDHDKPDERHAIVCPICQATTPDGSIHVMSHLAKHMEEITLTILPTNTDSEDGTDIDSGLVSETSSSSSLVTPCSPSQSRLASSVPDKTRTEPHLGEPGHDGEPTEPKHHPAIGYQCSGCSMRFIRIDNMKRHQNSRHCKYGMMNYNYEMKKFESPIEKEVLSEGSDAPRDSTSLQALLAQYPAIANTEMERAAPSMHKHGSDINLAEGDLNFEASKVSTEERYKAHSQTEINTRMKNLQEEREMQQGIATASSAVRLDKDIPADENEHDISSGISLHKISVLPLEQMATKTCRVPGCNKKFLQTSSLKKHELSHSRPWKCPIPTCKYHEYGCPSKRDVARHVQARHSAELAMYKCLFPPCPYKSKRESNCKQHMEKAHGWNYVRTKTNGRRKVTYSSEEWSLLKGLQDSMNDKHITEDVSVNLSDEVKLSGSIQLDERPAELVRVKKNDKAPAISFTIGEGVDTDEDTTISRLNKQARSDFQGREV